MREISVSVVYASADRQLSVSLMLPAYANVAMALRRSSIVEQFDELTMESLVVGLHGRKVALDASLQDQDRIEIYRPLQIDPMVARRQRVKRKA